MKKTLYLISTLLLSVTVLSLSSCLKDPRYIDFSKAGTIVDFPLGGLGNFGKDAITDAPADDANGTIVRQFAVNIASPNPPTTDQKVTLAVDNTLVDTYNASQSVVHYDVMPTEAYVFTATEVTIAKGTLSSNVSVTFYKNLLDPSKSYMLPIKIASGPSGATISSNFGIHYYHFIGNPFAGNYNWHYERRNHGDASGPPEGGSFDDVTTISPVTPTQFEAHSGYYTTDERYEVTFEVPDATHFRNFQPTMNTDDIANVFTANGITMTQPPVVYDATYDATKSYTFAESLQFLHYSYIVQNSSGFRFSIDIYTKP